MKTQVRFLFAALAMITFASSFVKAPALKKSESVNILTTAVCESCKARIERALKSTDGVIDANLNLNNKKIKVKFNPDKITADQIRTVISNTGYDADNVKRSETAFNNLPHCCQKTGGSCDHKE
jgi:periplasmic mercuric ion binding protein